MKLATIKTGAIRLVKLTGLKLNKYSPEILLGVGVVAIIGGVILACKETLKVEDIMDAHEEQRSKIEEAEGMELDNYTPDDASKDRAILFLKTAGKLIKNYIPSALLVSGGIACMFASYGILTKRNLALMAAYEAVSTAFDEYRKRVKDELGEEMDKHFRFGSEKDGAIEITDENDDVKERIAVNKVPGVNPSQYAKFFDEYNENWSKSPERNLFFLRRVQNWANDKLYLNGYLFLNDVYKMLGIGPTTAGQIVGWVVGKGDSFVDFGLYDETNERARMFVNGDERSILLDFNVDGVIYDLLDKLKKTG